MRIQIGLKLRPFSHRPGIICLIPFTTWEVQVFPALLKFRNLAGKETKDVPLKVEGPVKGFTVMLNLEKARVEVFGRGQKGYFRKFITPKEYSFLKETPLPPSSERLSLGIHKKQDWDLIQRRSDMAEIFPFWLRLSQLIPEKPLPKKTVGTMHLLDDLSLLFQVGFQGILSPRLIDENHLGLIKEETTTASPLALLHAGANEIRKLFCQEEGNTLHILPNLPKELHAGRYITPSYSIEWSKKQIKKIIIDPKETKIIYLNLRKVKTYRLRKSLRQRGEQRKRDMPIELKRGQRLYLDRFQH